MIMQMNRMNAPRIIHPHVLSFLVAGLCGGILGWGGSSDGFEEALLTEFFCIVLMLTCCKFFSLENGRIEE
jgi:hypothetical protein